MKKLLSTVAVLVGAALPAAAQTVYLPYVQTETLGANQVRTRIWVSNSSDAERRFSTYFLAAGTDGAALRGELPKITVAPQSTTIAAITGQPGIGMLELTGAPQLRYVGILETVDSQGKLLGSTTIPLIGSENYVAKDAMIDLQGFLRSTTRTTGLGVANVAKASAQCALTFYQANGTPIGSTVLITVAPLSMRFFADALGLLGQGLIADARTQITCDNTFYAFTVSHDTDGSNPLFVGPSSSGSSKLSPPGIEPPQPEGTITFRKDGEFLVARQGDSRVEYEIPVIPGADYLEVEAVFDFYLDRFHNPLFHTVASMRMDGVVWALTLRADRLKTIVDTNGASVNESANWQTKRTYQIRVVANSGSNEVFVRVRRGTEILQDITLPLGRRRLGTFTTNRPLRIDFSQSGVADEGAYWPLWGSRYSNLVVTATAVNSTSSPTAATEAVFTENEGLFELVPYGEEN